MDNNDLLGGGEKKAPFTVLELFLLVFGLMPPFLSVHQRIIPQTLLQAIWVCFVPPLSFTLFLVVYLRRKKRS